MSNPYDQTQVFHYGNIGAYLASLQALQQTQKGLQL
jgi:hypothetical protein